MHACGLADDLDNGQPIKVLTFTCHNCFCECTSLTAFKCYTLYRCIEEKPLKSVDSIRDTVTVVVDRYSSLFALAVGHRDFEMRLSRPTGVNLLGSPDRINTELECLFRRKVSETLSTLCSRV